jgi:hypothetical protein
VVCAEFFSKPRNVESNSLSLSSFSKHSGNSNPAGFSEPPNPLCLVMNCPFSEDKRFYAFIATV